MKVSLSPEDLAALNAESNEPIKAPLKPLPLAIVQTIRRQIAETFPGPFINPSFKSRLLMFVSLEAIKAGWAADHFQRMARERTRN